MTFDTEENLSSDLDRRLADQGETTDDSPLKGIRSSAVLRPEPLFHRRTRLIIDTHYNPQHNVLRNGLEEIEFQNLQLVSLEKLFASKREVFLGFGLPNVYLTIPNEHFDGYVKFAAFILWRQASAILDTKGRVQSGFFIRFRHCSEEMLTRLRRSTLEHSNQRHVSCAYANACVLHSASFTSDGNDLRHHFGARALFQRIYEYGLEFQGQPVTLDFIRTTPLTLEEHFHQVRKKEFTSLGRTCKKVANECLASNDKIRAPVLPANDIPTNPTVVGGVASFTRLQISRPHMFGALVRKIFGSHTLFKIIPDQEQIDVNTYLPETLKAFPVENPDLFTRIKKTFLFSRPVVMTLRKQLAALWDDHGLFSVGPLASMMSIHTTDEPHPYNIVITGTHLVGMHNNPFLNLKIVDWLLSKHVLISGYDDDVRFAGEAWMEHREDGLLLHLTNNSGTYKPTDEHLAQAGQFISAALPGLNVQLHSSASPLISTSPSTENQPALFTLENLFVLLSALIFCLCFVMFGHPKDHS